MNKANAASLAGTVGPPALLDHLVWLAGDLDAACAQFEALSGVAPDYGGVHPGGTHNAIVGLGDKMYLEIAAPMPEAEAGAGHPWVDAARQRPEPHLYSYCMRSTGLLSTLAEEVKAAGIKAFGPLPGSRTTPEGQTLKWQLFIPVLPGAGSIIPFHIDWQDTPHPARTSSSPLTLTGFHVKHAEPERFRDAMSLLAPGVRLERSESHSRLIARLSTPLGPVTLSN
ncbi:MAG: VOC family protein [Pseudomonadota bacterium]